MNKSSSIFSLLGTLDSASFIAKRTYLFKEHPKRAWGGVLLTIVWYLNFQENFFGNNRPSYARALASANLILNFSVLIGHLRHGIINFRILSSPFLAIVVFYKSIQGK